MDLYSQLRVLFSILLGLGVSHLLRGLARIFQHPKQCRVYWLHRSGHWFFFLYLIHFWWWEFRLRQVTEWDVPALLFCRPLRHDGMRRVWIAICAERPPRRGGVTWFWLLALWPM